MVKTPQQVFQFVINSLGFGKRLFGRG